MFLDNLVGGILSNSKLAPKSITSIRTEKHMDFTRLVVLTFPLGVNPSSCTAAENKAAPVSSQHSWIQTDSSTLNQTHTPNTGCTHRTISLLWSRRLPGEEDELGAVLLQALHIGL